MKIGLTVTGHHSDPTLDAQMKHAVAWGTTFEGDQVGPFDHPEGVAADAPFVVAHELGEKPGSFALEDPGYTGKGVYATAEDRLEWNEETVTLRSPDPTNQNIVIRVRRSLNA